MKFIPKIDCYDEDRDEIIDAISYEVDRLGLDYADTFRATPERKGIEEHVAKQSCCGNWEGKHTCRSGRTYFIGCNYGH